MEMTVTHNGIELVVTGDVIRAEPENNISEGFEANDIRDEFNTSLWDDFLEEDLQDIEYICLMKAKEDNQTNFETANT